MTDRLPGGELNVKTLDQTAVAFDARRPIQYMGEFRARANLAYLQLNVPFDWCACCQWDATYSPRNTVQPECLPPAEANRAFQAPGPTSGYGAENILEMISSLLRIFGLL
jgi:hypothetical protein